MNEQTDPQADLAALIAADPGSRAVPDLARLRAGGRRRLRGRRLAIGAATAAVLAVVAAPVAVSGLGGDDRAIDTPPAGQSTSEPVPAPSLVPTAEPPTPDVEEEEVRIPLPGGQFATGVLETGTVLGATVEMTPYEGYERFAYAASLGDSACLSVGLRVDGRIVRLVCALTLPIDDRWVMWNGYRSDDGTYELLGAFPGDVEVSIGPDGGPTREVTTRRTDVVPGYTVILDQAAWEESWDPLQPAPLTVMTGAGERYPLSRHTYVG